MNQLNNRINLDRAVGAEENISKGMEKMGNASKKTPWFLRFAPGAILRKKAIIAVLAIAVSLTTVQTKAATFLIDVITSWAIGEGLTAAKNKLLADNGGTNKAPLARLSPTAKAVANTAYWLSNSYNYTHKVDEWNSDTMRWTGNWTASADVTLKAYSSEIEKASGSTRIDATITLPAGGVPYIWWPSFPYLQGAEGGNWGFTEQDKERTRNSFVFQTGSRDIWIVPLLSPTAGFQ